MLPSTGLFQSFACPYFDGGGGEQKSGEAAYTTCFRPYCHFKHVRKDETEPKSAATVALPEYTPAPKLLTLPSFLMPPPKKKPELEYHPEKPGINASPSKRRTGSSDSLSSAPVYIPATTASYSAARAFEDCKEELDSSSGVFDTPVVDQDDNSKENEEEACSENQPTLEIKQEPAEEIATEIKKQSSDDTMKSSSRDHRHREKHRDSSTSSGSRHKHKSSSRAHERSRSKDRQSSRDGKRRSKEKESEKYKDRDRNKEKERDRDRDRRKERSKEISKDSESKTKKSSGSTSSSTSKHKTSSSSSSSRSDEKDRHRTSSTSSSKHKSSSSSSSSVAKSSRSNHHHQPSSSSHSSSSSSSKNKDRNAPKASMEQTPTSENSDFVDEIEQLLTPTDEDIMKECEMIYDQMEEEFAKMHNTSGGAAAAAEKEEAAIALKRKHSQEIEAQADRASAALGKKRVAYENADKYKSFTPEFVNKTDYVRNAMQAVYQRQADVKRKEEEDAAAALVALRQAEEKVREANEALRKAKEKNLTPLIPKSYLTPVTRAPSRLIAPVANMLALERAKKKVEELKAEKRPAFTPSQTYKGNSRIAHTSTAAQTASQADKKPKPPVLEANSSKISFNIRMQYYELMVKHCTTIYPNMADAWERAQTEELAVLKKCNTAVIYKHSALMAINKLRKEAAEAGNKTAVGNRLLSHEVILAGKLAHTTSWSVQKKMKTDASAGGEPFDKLPGEKAYDMVYDLRLTPEQLISNGYPRPGKRPGTAIFTSYRPMRRPNETERYCSRCGKIFSTSSYDEICVDECNYHPKSTGYRRGFVDNQHRCCQQPAGTDGCTYANYHVSDYVDLDNLTGYVSTIDKCDEYVSTKKDIYALDCEMCYTTHGIELTRVTVVDINSRTVYDALVKPDNKIVDYNTTYSGITENMLANETRSLRDVQAILMSMFHSKTVLVGHSLDSDLKALKLIHSVVVDTSVLFPHKMGPPKKRALKTLCIENLKRIIQENEAGHDSAEDAEVCIQLVKYFLRNKIS